MIRNHATLIVGQNPDDLDNNLDEIFITAGDVCGHPTIVGGGYQARYQDLYTEETVINSCAVPANRGADPNDRDSWEGAFNFDED